MSDQMREAVARVIDQEIPSIVPWGNKVIERCADAAIAAVIEELAKKAYDHALDIVHRESDASTDWLEVPDWLRAQLEEAK